MRYITRESGGGLAAEDEANSRTFRRMSNAQHFYLHSYNSLVS